MAIWEEKLKELITPGASKWPYRVVQIKPNRRRDNEIYTLSGREEDIASNGSLFLALYDLLERERIDFEEWWDQWEMGFPFFSNLRSTETSNYLLAGISPWRSAESRPRYREWTTPEQREQYGYRTIEYWPDRSVESSSHVLSGTDSDLVRHIVAIGYEGGGATSSMEKGKGGSLPYLKGQPLIVLSFTQDPSKVGINQKGNLKKPLRAEISLRIMDKTDNPRSPLDRITKADIEKYTNRIVTHFNNYDWEKGKDVISYRNRHQGLETWYLVRSKIQGIDLITRSLAVLGHTIDLTCVKYSTTEQPEIAYPDNPGQMQLLGETITLPVERPVVEVRFQNAELRLFTANRTIPLVRLGVPVYKA